MIVRILTIVFICTILVGIVFWIFTGGLSRGIAAAKNLKNPFDLFAGTSSGSFIQLPGQPEAGQFGATIDEGQYTDSTNSYADTLGSSNPQQTLSNLQDQYSTLASQAQEAKTFGTPSPYRGKVHIEDHSFQAAHASEEYVRIRTDFSVTAPISLAGWSFQSAVTSMRVYIPPAASPFISGTLNTVGNISLDPDSSVTLVSGPSPVGVSFRENKCTGYLAELQPFTPDLDRDCISPADELPLTPENIQTYGETCIDFLRTIPSCHFPGKDTNANISPTCRNFAINQLSYNGCVYAHRYEASFNKGSWRLYAGSATTYWRPTHDVIRLLDEQGRTVDVLTY